jgi:phosphate transport system substrate-binding protein
LLTVLSGNQLSPKENPRVNNVKTRLPIIAGALSLSLLAAACGSSTKSATSDASKLAATLNASGSTFVAPFVTAAIDDFAAKAKGVKITYGGGGSGKGRQDLADQLVDFAGSDGTIADADKAKFKGGDVLYFPVVVAPITLSYNLSGVAKLQLTPKTIANIFQGKITKWNDAAIAADNSGTSLPDKPIVVAVRSDSSGTTSNFTTFLDKSVGTGGDGTWTLKSGSTVQWPAGVQAGAGNSGVAQIIKSTDGAIGYVDYSDAKANKFSFATVQNKAGKFVEASLDGATAAATATTVKDNLTFNLAWADGDASYPIAAQTWILVYKNQTDKAKGAATKAFINFLLTDEQTAAKDLDFAALPKDLDTKAIAQLAQIVIPA